MVSLPEGCASHRKAKGGFGSLRYGHLERRRVPQISEPGVLGWKHGGPNRYYASFCFIWVPI